MIVAKLRNNMVPLLVTLLALPVLVSGAAGASGSSPKRPEAGEKTPDGCSWDHFGGTDAYPRLYCPSMEVYRAAARAGSGAAMHELGFHYQLGLSEPKDDRAATLWFRAAAEKQYPPAMTELAVRYFEGVGMPIDRAKGRRWLRRSVEVGEPYAIYLLGGMTLVGDGVKRDRAEALRLLHLAARKGEPYRATAAPGSIVSTITKQPEHIGQCFTTKIDRIWRDDESVVRFKDGHFNFSGDRAVLNRSRRGDPVQMCVTALPADCPPGDTRGLEYRVLNLRTGSSWDGNDSHHVCGGA